MREFALVLGHSLKDLPTSVESLSVRVKPAAPLKMCLKALRSTDPEITKAVVKLIMSS
jgi:hypothetical protein